ncbi:serine endopeptidase [Flavobacterium cauense R2A-7]|uniref:Putative secreted protein (Por secretion system target) n=1 Tax=Flavobacterium cauense R2A-7 TaxID=1341154 RepID=V6SAB9_9FLAO|nr:S8 family serine peptidase [Flavobacterium cauense]ESU21355.1 serine endopeptidase [Flavobacterium cauense R2A-7]KGO79999.1 peptidase S8 [Flavobacterium cauense R2A-7]TWI08939.1 putative secreted protein (Por secretion system target) [Flavobacterium cauense R2A-7]
MKKALLLFVLLLTTAAFSQEDAWVYFADKPLAQSYIDNPLSMLSQRALDRRTTQGIGLNVQDAPIHQLYIDQVTAATGITVMAKSKWLNALHVRGSQTDIAALSGLPFVNRIHYANHSLNPGGRQLPQANLTTSRINKFLDTQVNYNYGGSATQVQMLKADWLHQQDFTGSGKVVAIMDAGFPGVNTEAPFQRLRDNNLILGGYDFVNKVANPYTGYQHGTQVLSNMGGYVDAQLIGTAPDAHYYLFITEDVNSENPVEESNWVEALEMADSLGVDVVNTSLGYFEYDTAAYSYTYDDMDGQTSFASRAADIAFSKGMICVTSAGNSGNTANPHIGVPGDAATVLTVGAVNNAEIRATFSSIGPSFDGRIKPDVMAMGVAATVATQSGAIATNNGTSFAGPILAGAVTSFWSAFPNKTNAEIVQLVKASADRFASPDNNYGYGIPDFQQAYNTALLSVSEFDAKGFVVYPNPANNQVTVTFTDVVTKPTIAFYNSLGQLVLQQTIENNPAISLDNLNSGIYIYKITFDNVSQTGKLVKK